MQHRTGSKATQLIASTFILLLSTFLWGDSLAFGINGDNGDGCDIPDVFVEYEHDTSDTVNAHGRVHNKGNRVCEDTLAVDIAIEADFGNVSVEFGYDRRGVTAIDGNDFYYGSVKAETANINADFDIGDTNLELGVDVVKEVPRLAIEAPLPFGLEFELDVTFYDAGEFTTGRLSWEHTFDDKWSVEAFTQRTEGVLNVPDGVSWAVGPPSNPPDAPYAFGLGVKRSF